MSARHFASKTVHAAPPQSPFRYVLFKTNLMRRIILTGILFSLLVITSCSKSNSSPSNSIVGTWIFTNQITFSNPYPAILTNMNPLVNSTYAISSDSINVTFSNNGDYSFSNFHLPVDKGTYSIVQDSFLVIKPDTSDFVKFNYTLPTVVFGTGTSTNQPLPYAGFQFTSDTILFKRTNNNIAFTGAWLAKADRPLQPSGDTILLNQVINYFKKQ